jgi:biotin carboxylase
MKNRIVVAEPMSTAFGFLEDIRQRGYEPVILESYIPEGYARRLMDEERKIKYSRIKYPIAIIKEDPDYAVTLQKVRELEPLLVIAGGEEGVVIGTRLADDLGLTGNPFSNIDKMTQKSVMHDALKEAGLRYIRGEEVSSLEDCLLFLEKTGKQDVVLKHVHGVASVGVHLVCGREELAAALRQEETAENMFGETENRLMLQERIFGEEYIVNTVSRNGVPALTSVFRYYKKQMPSGSIIYRGLEAVTELGQRETELVRYAFDVVRALGITDGPVHGEYMIDEQGPVLIEANCRVMGGSAPSGFLDKVFGYHETGVILDCMLDSNYHRDFLEKPYRPIRKGYVKDFYSGSSKTIFSSGIVPIILNMRSYYSGWVENAGKTDSIAETIDLETEIGCVYMVHDDPEVTKRDFDLLMLIEEKYPDLLHSDKPLFLPPEDASGLTPDIRFILGSDTESLINDIISFYKNGSKGDPIIPEKLLNANPYNREIMDILKSISGA